MISGFLLAALLRLTFASDLNVSTSKYSRSHNNDLYDGPVLDTVVVRSTSHCAAVCSRNDRCYAFDVCPRTGSLKQADCSLLGDSNLQAGNSLKPGTEKKCFQMVKVNFILSLCNRDMSTDVVILCLKEYFPYNELK